MCHHKDTIEDVTLNITNREAELAKPLIRLFKHSPGVLEELLPALQKCLDAKRKVKSTSLESYLYTAINNLTTNDKEAMDNLTACKGVMKNDLVISNLVGWTIDYAPIIWEIKRITCAESVPEEDTIRCHDLGKVTHAKIIGTLVDKFKATRTHIGSR